MKRGIDLNFYGEVSSYALGNSFVSRNLHASNCLLSTFVKLYIFMPETIIERMNVLTLGMKFRHASAITKEFLLTLFSALEYRGYHG
mgnify:CR=1 FL=1